MVSSAGGGVRRVAIVWDGGRRWWFVVVTGGGGGYKDFRIYLGGHPVVQISFRTRDWPDCDFFPHVWLFGIG